jgi:hypothetical protein
MDVVLDVRERLAPSRIHFRAAIAAVAAELAAGDPQTEVKAIEDLRARIIEPALDEIREHLATLGARRTLLRAASDRVALATTAAQLSLVAGAGGGLSALSVAAHGVLSAPIVSAVAKELDRRAEARAQLRLRPYWLLHETGSLMSKA